MGIFCGIDIGKFSHFFCAVDKEGKELRSFEFANSFQGFKKAFKAIQQLKENKDGYPSCAMEATAHHWMNLYEYLNSKGVEVKVINPLQSNRFRDFYIQPVKNDPKDAYVIANLLRFGQVTQTKLFNPRIQALRKLTRFRSSLVKKRTRIKRQILTLLDNSFPEYQQFKFFSNVFGKTSLAFLKQFPTPHSLSRVSLDKLNELLSRISKKKIGQEKAAQILKISKDSIYHRSVNSEATFITRSLIDQLEQIESYIKRTEEEILKILNKIPQTLTTIPGFNFITVATIIGEIGDIHRFQSANELAAYCGMVPNIYQSGTFLAKRSHMAKRGVSQLSHVFYQAAVFSVRLNSQIKEYHKSKLEQGIKGKRAIIAVSRKLIRIVYHLMKTNQPYTMAKMTQDNPR